MKGKLKRALAAALIIVTVPTAASGLVGCADVEYPESGYNVTCLDSETGSYVYGTDSDVKARIIGYTCMGPDCETDKHIRYSGNDTLLLQRWDNIADKPVLEGVEYIVEDTKNHDIANVEPEVFEGCYVITGLEEGRIYDVFENGKWLFSFEFHDDKKVKDFKEQAGGHSYNRIVISGSCEYIYPGSVGTIKVLRQN